MFLSERFCKNSSARILAAVNHLVPSESFPAYPPSLERAEFFEKGVCDRKRERLWGPLTPLDSSVRCYSASVRDEINNSLRAAWDRGHALPWVFTRVRAAFAQAPAGYARVAGVGSRSIIERLERCAFLDPDRPFDTIYHTMLKFWERSEIERPELAPFLSEARREMIRALVPDEQLTSLTLLRKWRIEVGPDLFSKAIGRNADDKLRKQSADYYVNPERVVEIGRAIGFIPRDLRASDWEAGSRLYDCISATIRTATRNQRSEGIAALFLLLSALDISTSKAALQRTFGVDNAEASRLVRGRCAGAKKINAVLNQWVEQGNVSSDVAVLIKDHWHEHASRTKFSILVRRLMRIRGWDEAFLADCLGLENVPNRERIEARTERMAGFRIGAPGEIALLLSRTERQFERLCAVARAQLADELRGSGSVFASSAIYIERALWGLSREEIAGVDPSFLKQVELGRSAASAAAALLATVRTTALNVKIPATLRRYFIDTRAADVIKSLQRCKARPACAEIESEIGRYISGDKYISLMRYREILERGGYDHTPLHELHWHHYFSHGGSTHLHLRRALSTLYAQTAERETLSPVASSALSRCLHSAHPIRLERAELEALCEVFKAHPQSFLARYLDDLNWGATPCAALTRAMTCCPHFEPSSLAPLQGFSRSDISALLSSAMYHDSSSSKGALLELKFSSDASSESRFHISAAQEALLAIWRMAPGARLIDLIDAISEREVRALLFAPLQERWPATLSLLRRAPNAHGLTLTEARPYENFLLPLEGAEEGAKILIAHSKLLRKLGGEETFKKLSSSAAPLYSRPELSAEQTRALLGFLKTSVLEALRISSSAKKEFQEQLCMLSAKSCIEYLFSYPEAALDPDSFGRRLGQVLSLFTPAKASE